MGSFCLEIPHDRLLVTGGGSGIGRAVALKLASFGKTVYVVGRRQGALDETVSKADGLEGTVIARSGDATDAEDVDRLFSDVERDGPVTGLVHAAAQVSLGLAKDMSPDEFRRTVDSTLCAAFNVLQRWANSLFAAGTGGAAVALTSSTATAGIPGISHSSAGKAGLTSLARAVGREWGPAGVRVNCIGPGAFPIAKSEAMFADDTVQGRMRQMIAIGRYGQLDEIVDPILFFLSSGGTYITGQSLVVDGGQTLLPWLIPEEALQAGVNNQYS
jgi:NAD(P)-dependent dehydrogenase (short-subunit alcohol dehydrogenase family)